MMCPPCPSILTLAVGKVLHVEDKAVATESILKSVAIDRETVSLG
jgi:hypothetical protein